MSAANGNGSFAAMARDLAEGAARADIDWKAEGIRSSALEFVASDISACLRASISARLHTQCLVASTGSRFSRKRRSKSALCAMTSTTRPRRSRATEPSVRGSAPCGRYRQIHSSFQFLGGKAPSMQRRVSRSNRDATKVFSSIDRWRSLYRIHWLRSLVGRTPDRHWLT